MSTAYQFYMLIDMNNSKFLILIKRHTLVLIVLVYVFQLICCSYDNDIEIHDSNNVVNDTRDGLMHLFNITYIKEHTPNYEHLRVRLIHVPMKGNGVFATRKIKEGRTVSYYKLVVQDNDIYESPFNRDYNFRVYGKDGKPCYHLTSDLGVESLARLKGRIPFWGYLVNEPSENQTRNVEIDADTYENYRNRNYVGPGDSIIYKYVSIRDIEPGEEITSCYGKNYVRDYKTSCTNV